MKSGSSAGADDVAALDAGVAALLGARFEAARFAGAFPAAGFFANV